MIASPESTEALSCSQGASINDYQTLTKSQFRLMAALSAMMLTSPVSAESLGELMRMIRTDGQAVGLYQSNNQIRTFAATDAHSNVNMARNILLKAAEMTQEKGFPRFAVTKFRCSTTLMNNIPLSDGCYLIALMLQEGEEAKARGREPVKYYRPNEVFAENMRRFANPPSMQSEEDGDSASPSQ